MVAARWHCLAAAQAERAMVFAINVMVEEQKNWGVEDELAVAIVALLLLLPPLLPLLDKDDELGTAAIILLKWSMGSTTPIGAEAVRQQDPHLQASTTKSSTSACCNLDSSVPLCTTETGLHSRAQIRKTRNLKGRGRRQNQKIDPGTTIRVTATAITEQPVWPVQIYLSILHSHQCRRLLLLLSQ